MKPQAKTKNNKRLKSVKQIAKIKYLLKLKGYKQIDIARALKISESAVSHVISGRQKVARVDLWLEENLGLVF